MMRSSAKSSDLRDKVVALLALADELAQEQMGSGSRPGSEFICPHNRKPVEELYLKTAHYIV
jgi:hypothetical protein